MFNVSQNAKTELPVIIQKTHPKSWFEAFGLKSGRAMQLLAEGGDRGKKRSSDPMLADMPHLWEDCPENAITVLQLVLCGKEVLAECVYTKDYHPDIESS